MNMKLVSTILAHVLARASLTTLAISFSFLGACTSPQSKTFSGKAVKVVSVSEISKGGNRVLSQPDIEERVRSMGTAEYFAAVGKLLTDDTIEFGGYQFDGLAERYKADAELQAEYAIEFPTIGDIMDSKGIDALPTTITEQDIAEVAKSLNDYVNKTESSIAEDQGAMELLESKTCRREKRVQQACSVGSAAACTASVAQAGVNPASDAACGVAMVCSGTAQVLEWIANCD